MASFIERLFGEWDTMKTQSKKLETLPAKVTPFYKAMLDLGLVGCAKGPGDAATRHSDYLRGYKRAKKKAAA
jgi:hypothetical protein